MAGLMAWFIPLIAAAITAAATTARDKKQAKENRKLAEFQAGANERLLAQQLEYNTPKNQMSRFQEAGLNPHLIYGQGSPGNQQAPLSYPDIKATDYHSIADALPMYNQTRMVEAQVQAQNATTRQKTALTELNKLQTKVMAANPLLDAAGFSAIISSLKSTAEIKASESGIKASELQVQQASAGHQVSKIFHEVQLLEQRFNLGSVDARIKAEIVKSKEFQNAILEVQKKFMTDGDVTPQHILQFIQMLLLKML